MDRRILYIWLSKIKGIGPVITRNLIEFFKRIDFVYEATYDELIKVEGIGDKLAKIIVENKDLSKSKEIYYKCKRSKIKIITMECSNYPKQLKNFKNAPIILYVKGELKEFDNAVCIVGSRRCTEYSKNITVELTENLSKRNIPIISGMAKGIDGYSHTVALHNDNYTIAVVGTGVDICYPIEHLTLMNEIIKKGAVISQFEPGTSNIKSNFIKRNELMAMLAEKIIVVEATKDSGAVYTAHCGMKYKKEVYSVPGNINNKSSEGTNMLISEGAKPYLSVKSIIKEEVEICSNNLENDKNLGSIKMEILKLIDKNKMSVDELKIKLNFVKDNLEEILLDMELKGYIRQVSGYIENDPRGF